MHYRADIDGLRAAAVLPAIFFHAGFPGFDGGYIGIEIFFVVSGYLITNIIINEQSKGRFSLVNFYERRARRILPALSLVLFVTTLVAYLLMPDYLLEWYSQSLVAVSAFISNIYFYYTTGYFASAAGEKPLLHMWSLAVEEQYYFIYPLFILSFSLSVWFRKALPFVVLILLCASLAFAHYLALIAEHKANYYHTLSRAWELLIGGLIAFWALDKKPYAARLREVMCALGLLMIAYGVVFFDQYTLYPSLLTLVPVLGTCFIIVFGQQGVFVSRLLSLPIVVLIGLMSYSVYLWHHPIYAFMRLKTVGEPAEWQFVIAVCFTLLLGYLSWRYVETPFRDKQRFSRQQIFSLSALSIVFFVGVGSAGQYFKGFPERFSHEAYTDSVQYSEKRGACHTTGENYLKPEEACEYFGDKLEWAVMGDSHSVEIAYQLARRLESKNIAVKHLSFSDCPPSLYFEVQKSGCTAWFHEAFNYLLENPDIKHVMLVYRHSKFLFGEHVNDYPDLPDIDPNTYFSVESRVASAQQARELYWRGFESMIDAILAKGKTVYVVYPIPEIPMEFRNAAAPYWLFSQSSIMDLQQVTDREYYKRRQAFILEKLNTLDYKKNLHALDPLPAFCNDNHCAAVHESRALYIDDDHPSLYGAKRIIKLLDME